MSCRVRFWLRFRQKGLVADELAGMASVLLEQSAGDSASVQWRQPVIDTCGTGAMGPQLLISLPQWPLLPRRVGLKWPSMGNRSASSRVGSADVLEALGII